MLCSYCGINEALPPCSTGLKRYLCRECENLAHKRFYNNNKEKRLFSSQLRREKQKEFLDSLKNKPCTDCGLTFPPCCMDFDHRDPTTKIKGVSQMVCFKLERLMEEISKCDLVCSNCHRIRTDKRKLCRGEKIIKK